MENKRLRTAKVEELIATTNLNDANLVDIIYKLELYVLDEASYNLYSFKANSYLLQLYKDNPERLSTHWVIHILIKGIMALPADHFDEYVELLPDNVKKYRKVEGLKELLGLLKKSEFRQFWEAVDSNFYRNMLGQIGGFRQTMEAYIIDELSKKHGKVPKPVLSTSVAKFGRALEEYIEFGVTHKGWVVEKDEFRRPVINIPRTDNHP